MTYFRLLRPFARKETYLSWGEIRNDKQSNLNVWPPQVTTYHFKTPLIFPVKALYLEPLVNNHLSWPTATTFLPNSFTVFNGTDLTSCKRKLSERFLWPLYVLHHSEYTKNSKWQHRTARISNLETVYKRYKRTDPLWLDSRERPLPVSDH